MNNPPSILKVALVNHDVCIKVCERANFTCSLDLKKLVQELSQRGYNRFILDLSGCINMDSTFLGVLAGIGLKFEHCTTDSVCRRVELLNPNARIADLLENLGVAHLFEIINQAVAPVAPENFQALAPDENSRVEVARTCLEAHQTLMDLNPENVAKFKDCAQFMAEDLKRLEGEAEKTQS